MANIFEQLASESQPPDGVVAGNIFEQLANEGKVKWGVKDTLRASGAVLGSFAAMPIAGVGGYARLMTAGPEEATKTIEDISAVPSQVLTTDRQREAAQKIGDIISWPFVKAGKGLAGIAELISTGDFNKATDVIEGRSVGSNISVPIADVAGQVIGMGAAGGAGKKAKGIFKKVFDTLPAEKKIDFAKAVKEESAATGKTVDEVVQEAKQIEVPSMRPVEATKGNVFDQLAAESEATRNMPDVVSTVSSPSGNVFDKLAAETQPAAMSGGKQEVLYHGTNAEYADTEIATGKKMYGIHLTTDEAVAKDYGKVKKYVLAKDAKTLDLSDPESLWGFMKKEGILDAEDITNIDLENYTKNGQLFQYDISSRTHLADDVAKTAESLGYDVVKMPDDLGGRGDNIVQVVVNKKVLQPPSPLPEVVIPSKSRAKGPENLIEYVRAKGGVDLGADYSDTGRGRFQKPGKNRELEYPDVKRISNSKTGRPVDEMVADLNSEGFNFKSADEFMETIKSGKGRNIFTPDKSDAKINRQIERDAHAYWDEQAANFEAENSLDAGALESRYSNIIADTIETSGKQGFSIPDPAAAFAELDNFFTTKKLLKTNETADLAGMSAAETFGLSSPELKKDTGVLTKNVSKAKTVELYANPLEPAIKAVVNSRPVKALINFFDFGHDIPGRSEYMYSRQGALGEKAIGENLAEAFAKKYRYLKPEERQMIWEQMNSGEQLASLPDNLQKPAQQFRALDNALGKQLVDNGLMSAETFAANEGNHIRYIYDVYQQGENLIGGGGNKLNTKFLKERKDLSDIDRERLGIIKDPIQAIVNSIVDTHKAVGMKQHFENIAGNPDWIFEPSVVKIDGQKMGIGKVQKMLDAYRQVEKTGELNKEQVAYREQLQGALDDATTKNAKPPEGYIQLNGAGYGSLDGTYVLKPIAQDIKPILDVFKTSSEGTNKVIAGIATANGLWKMKNVALNIPTMARNIISNPSQLMMSGMRPDRVITRTVEAIGEMVKDGPNNKAAREQGVFTTNFSRGELEDILQIAKTFDSQNWVGFLSKVQGLGKYYGKIDDVFKLAKFIDERSYGKSIQESALQANKWGMDYSFVHPAVKVLRNAPFGAPFLSYQYKIAPLIVESIAKRPWVIASIFALPTLLQQAVTKDMTDEDAKNFLSSLPEHVQNKQVFLIPGKEGMNALDISYMVPWGNWYQVGASFADNKPSKAFKQLGVGNGLLPSVLYGVTTGKDLFTGRDIVSDLEKYDPKMRAWAVSKWMWQQAAPPMLTETSVVGKVAEHLKYGQTPQGLKTTAMNVYPRIAGVNIYPVDPSGKAKGEQFEIKNVKKALIRKLYDRNATPAERQAARDAYRMAIGEIRGQQAEQPKVEDPLMQ